MSSTNRNRPIRTPSLPEESFGPTQMVWANIVPPEENLTNWLLGSSSTRTECSPLLTVCEVGTVTTVLVVLELKVIVVL